MRVEIWIWDSNRKLVAVLWRYRNGDLAVYTVEHETRDITPTQFEEWHSFSRFVGHSIDYIVCDADLNETKVYRNAA